MSALKMVHSLVYLVNYSVDLTKEEDSNKALNHETLCIKMHFSDKINSMDYLETHHKQIMGSLDSSHLLIISCLDISHRQ